jgi:uncharacterized protein (DUF2062 family)
MWVTGRAPIMLSRARIRKPAARALRLIGERRPRSVPKAADLTVSAAVAAGSAAALRPFFASYMAAPAYQKGQTRSMLFL